MVLHKNLSGGDLHTSRIILNSGTPLNVLTPNVSGEVVYNLNDSGLWIANSANIGSWSQLNHETLTAIGTNTHAQIDSHISSTSNPHSTTASQVGSASEFWNANALRSININASGASNGMILRHDGTNVSFLRGQGYGISGNSVVQRIDFNGTSATASTTTTSTSFGDRSTSTSDWGNLTKWNLSGLSTPVITFYVVGRNQNAGSTAWFDLLNKSTSNSLGSLGITSTTAFGMGSIVLNQNVFPSGMQVLSLRTKASSGTAELYSATLEAVWGLI